MAIKLVRETRVAVTKRLAEWLMSMPVTVWERKLSQVRVENYGKLMKTKQFYWEWVSWVVITHKGIEYRGNGQHTGNALLYFVDNEKVLEGAKVRIIYYEVGSEEEMRELYSQIDRVYGRSQAQVALTRMLGTPEFEGATTEQIRLLVSGYRLMAWVDHHERGKHNIDEVADTLLGKANAVARHLLEVVGSRAPDKVHVYRAPVVAAMLLTYAKAADASREFWLAVRDGSGLDTGDPRKRLRDHLMTRTVNSGRGAAVATKGASESSEIMLRVCLVAWRAWRQGRKLQLLKSGPIEDARPVVI